ncbi:hypothetical protein [Xanthomarina sp. GH4-25]|uniref:hypothetical protein n=1 Tax=Xanthomarina sp. GH4-25 TaxID=3349335 RepID=UPI003877D83B
MKRNLYTKEEIILCTYIARFGRSKFDESDIHKLKERSISSIKMKVQNIASMLVENGFEIDSEVSILTGKPHGKKGRRTNWDIVEALAATNKIDLFNLCSKII